MRNVKGARPDQEPIDMRNKKERHKDEEDEKGKKDLQTDRQIVTQRDRELNWADPSNRKLLTKNEGIYLFSILPSLVVMSCGQSDEDEEDELQNKTEIET